MSAIVRFICRTISRTSSKVRNFMLTFSFYCTLSVTAQRYLAAVQPVAPDKTVTDTEVPDDTQYTWQPTQPTITRVSRMKSATFAGPVTHASKPYSDPYESTGVPPLPTRGSNPSDGVAHRLALAREQARLRLTQRQGAATPTDTNAAARLASRALVRSSSSIGSARRVVVSRPDIMPPRTPTGKTSADSKVTSPFCTSSQFTPKRKPFSVVNEDRSPQNRATPRNI